MKTPLGDVELPALVGANIATNTYKIVRSLTETDLTALQQARNTYAVANPTMAMFGILYLNYQDLMTFTATLPPQPGQVPDPILNANRFILNYLAAADALLDHFSTTYKRQCRLRGLPVTGFDDLRKELARTDDDFEFVTRFRDHVLHAGLPVGVFNQSNSVEKGKTWSITYKVAELLTDAHGKWKTCRVLVDAEDIDLIAHIERFHKVMMTRLFQLVVSCFRRDLQTAHKFHDRITREVQQIGLSFRPCIMTTSQTTGREFNMTFDVLPVDLMDALGIQMKPDDDKK